MKNTTASSIPPEKMAEYRATALQRAERDRKLRRDRWMRARRAAEAGSALLKQRYGATCVFAFGSLLTGRLFHIRSDIDLAAWNIDERQYLRALADLMRLDPEFAVDLIRMEEATPGLREHIEQTGQRL